MADESRTNGSATAQQAMHDAQARFEQFSNQAQARLDQVRARLEDADRRARNFVQEYPVTTVLGAVLVGYLLARLARRA